MKQQRVLILFGIAAVLIVGGFLAYRFVIKGTPQLAQETQPTPKNEVNALTFYHWWTSPSESAAIGALIAVFSKKYPDVAIVAAPVVGGAGFKMLPVVKSLVAGGEGPDAFQMHAGYEARPYFDGGLLSNIDYIWQSEGLEKVIPPVIQDMDKFEGHYYSVPVNVHRSNVIWYNKSVLDKYGIDPKTLTTWDAVFKAADTLRAGGITNPIQMGESWTAAHVFEQIVAGQGINFYEDWVNGKVTSPDDPRLIAALTTLKKYFSYVNTDHNDITWDAATKRIIKGEGALNLMGDWANGEFKLVGMKYGKDYGTFLAPGTQSTYGLVIDTFQHPKGISHPTNSDRWLKVVASREGQDAFSQIKGSISARNDSDVSGYDAYQKSAISDFKTATHMYPSIVHGSGAPEAFKLKLIDIIGTFSVDGNINKAALAITNTTKQLIAQYNRVWSLK